MTSSKDFKFKVVSEEIFDEDAYVEDVYGQGCNYPTVKGVGGLLVWFVIEGKKEGVSTRFNIIYQSADRRLPNIKAYHGHEMSKAEGLNGDEDEREDFLDYFDNSVEAEEFLESLEERAEEISENWMK